VSQKVAIGNRARHALTFGGLLVLGSPGLGAAPDDLLLRYLGPQPGKTYVYEVTGPKEKKALPITVASAPGQNSHLRMTCSPASAAEYPKELQDRGAQPVISKLEVEDGAIVAIRGGGKSTLLRAPLRPSSELWENRQTAVVSGGKRITTVFQCGISEIGRREVLGHDRSTVSVQCLGKNSAGSLLTSTTYAEGVGIVEETTESSDRNMKSTGKYKEVLSEIRDGADSCAALIKSVSRKQE